MLQFKSTMICHSVVQTTPPETHHALCTLALSILATKWFQMIIKTTVSITEQFLPTQLQCPWRQHGQLCDGCRVKYSPRPELCPSATPCTRSIFQDDLMRSTLFEHCICEGQTQDLQCYSLENQTLSLPEHWNLSKFTLHLCSPSWQSTSWLPGLFSACIVDLMQKAELLGGAEISS